jgi:hypothetical protein
MELSFLFLIFGGCAAVNMGSADGEDGAGGGVAGDEDWQSQIYQDWLFALNDSLSYTMTVHSPTMAKFHEAVIHADEHMRLGVGLKGPSTFCGAVSESECPRTGRTLVDSRLSHLMVFYPIIIQTPSGAFSDTLQVKVSGGQQLFTVRSGDIMFTAAYSSNKQDAVGFQWGKKIARDGETRLFYWLGEKGYCRKMLVCDSPALNHKGRYIVAANVCNLNHQQNCHEIEGIELQPSALGVGAWQYGVGKTETIPLPGDQPSH